MGFPHSDTYGSTLCLAAHRTLSWPYTVLLRQHVPRHPPRALSRLSFIQVLNFDQSSSLPSIALLPTLRLFADL